MSSMRPAQKPIVGPPIDSNAMLPVYLSTQTPRSARSRCATHASMHTHTPHASLHTHAAHIPVSAARGNHNESHVRDQVAPRQARAVLQLDGHQHYTARPTMRAHGARAAARRSHSHLHSFAWFRFTLSSHDSSGSKRWRAPVTNDADGHDNTSDRAVGWSGHQHPQHHASNATVGQHTHRRSRRGRQTCGTIPCSARPAAP
jgi:hypothetical protein